MLGKMRPLLQQKVDSNNEKLVIEITKEAFELFNNNNLIDGLKKLIDNLDGVGIATASYIGALMRPDLCPIMYDEVIQEITNTKIKYDFKTYIKIQKKIIEIIDNINNLKFFKNPITAEEVSRIFFLKIEI